MDQEIMHVLEEVISEALAQSAISSLVGLLGYVFSAHALYTIASYRGINKPWLAWIPLVNIWILGSISDQYRFVTKGQNTNRRTILLISNIVIFLLSIFTSVKVLASLGNFFHQLSYSGTGALEALVAGVSTSLFIMIPLVVLSIVGVVYEIMSLHDVFVSCDPGNGVLFLILSLIPGINTICRPLFLFLCRNKDNGMPPRKKRREAWEDTQENSGEDDWAGSRRDSSSRGDTWDDDFQ